MNKKQRLFLSALLCCSLISPTQANTAVAAGDYFNDQGSYLLLANTKNQGDSWQFSIHSGNPSLPENFGNGQFFSANCTGSHCIAAGFYYFDTIKHAYPLLAHSQDEGDTWTYVLDSTKPSLPKKFTMGVLYKTSCEGSNCLVAGFYQDKSSHLYPLLARSTNGGAEWKYIIDQTSPKLPSGFKDGRFTSVTCSGSSCVAGGYYNSFPFYPLLANSQDGGKTWGYVLDARKPSLPTDFSQGIFLDLSCSGSNCVAAGIYGIDKTSMLYPLVAHSNDGGAHWTYTVQKSKPKLPEDFILGMFTQTNCTELDCVAVGFYLRNRSPSPLIAHSADGGANFTYVIDSQSTALPKSFLSGDLNSVSCKGKRCVAVGAYDDGSRRTPLLLQSQDGGTSWSDPMDSAKASLPADFEEGSFSGVSCNGLHCIASGSYSSETSLYPLLANSKDGGLTWTYAIHSSSPGLPTDFKNGGFSSTAIASLLGLKLM